MYVTLVIALRLQTPKYIRGGWSHYTDTSEPVDGNGAQNVVTQVEKHRLFTKISTMQFSFRFIVQFLSYV
jgi:hypothetical protein